MSKKKIYEFTPDYAVVPGESLREEIEYLGMSQVEFAQRLDITVQSLNRILKGEQPITYDTARKLELVTGISCEYWNNLEARYQEQLQLIALKKQRQDFELFNKKFPVKELAEQGFIQSDPDPLQQSMQILRFFRVSSIDAYNNLEKRTMAAARSSQAFHTSPSHILTYIYMGLYTAKSLSLNDYDDVLFRQTLEDVRLITKKPPANFGEILQQSFAKSGVALVFVKPFKGLHISAVCKWISSNNAMIIMNIRGKAEDRFWFSLFHEAMHILHHRKKELYITDKFCSAPCEEEADKKAAEMLIPSKYNKKIILATTSGDIIKIADMLDISPGIVAGRYQHLTGNWGKYKTLIRSFNWAEHTETK